MTYEQTLVQRPATATQDQFNWQDSVLAGLYQTDSKGANSVPDAASSRAKTNPSESHQVIDFTNPYLTDTPPIPMGDLRDLRQSDRHPMYRTSDATSAFNADVSDKIRWYEGFTNAYSEGLRENKPIVMVFEDSSSRYTADMEQVMASPLLQKYAGHAVFGHAYLPQDKFAMQAAQKLNIQNVPTVSVFAPKSDQLKELTRFEGIWKPEEIAADFDKYLAHGGSTVA